MTIFSVDKEDAERLTTPGKRCWSWPAASTLTPYSKRPDACSGCALAATHDLANLLVFDLPLGEHRYQRIPLKNRPDAAEMHKLQGALWHPRYVHGGMIPLSVQFNVGNSGNNGVQGLVYEILDHGFDIDLGTWLQLRGRDWGAISIGNLRENPDHPFPDPATGQTSKLVSENLIGSFPPCATAVVFLRPSVLAEKLQPLITHFGEATGGDVNAMTFKVYFKDYIEVENAIQPIDLAKPPVDGKYYVELQCEFLNPPQYKDFQAPFEQQFSPRTVVFTTAAVHPLLDANGDETKVLFPWMKKGNVTLFSAAFDPAVSVDIATRLSTVLDAGVYKSRLDLTGLTFTQCTVTFWAESTASDTTRVPVTGQCRHARVDPSATFIHDGNRFCGQTESSGFQAGKFHNRCWLPGVCSAFSIDDESTGTMGDHEFLASLWVRAGWIIYQDAPGASGARGFKLGMIAGESIAGLMGSWCDEVPGGIFPMREEWQGRSLGVAHVYNDSEGDHVEVRHGAFYYSPYTGYTPDAFGTLAVGVLANKISGWVDDKDLTGFPFESAGYANVYSYQAAGSPLRRRLEPVVDGELFVAAADVEQVGDVGLIQRIAALYG